MCLQDDILDTCDCSHPNLQQDFFSSLKPKRGSKEPPRICLVSSNASS